MKKDIEYRDVAKEIVAVLANYETTIKEAYCILQWAKSEIEEQVIQESAD